MSSEKVQVTRSLNDTPWGYQSVSSPVRAGETAQRFEIRAGECGTDESGSDCDRNSERSEVASDVRWDIDETIWVGASLFLPRGFRADSGWTHIIQFKSSNPKNLIRNPQPFSLTIDNRRLVATFGWLDQYDEQQFELVDLMSTSQLEESWSDFQIGIGPALGNRIVVYRNGRQIVSRPIRYTSAEDTYLKYGIYRPAASYTNVLVWDEIRLGATREEVGLNLDMPVD
jgi:hypothetical protein